MKPTTNLSNFSLPLALPVLLLIAACAGENTSTPKVAPKPKASAQAQVQAVTVAPADLSQDQAFQVAAQMIGLTESAPAPQAADGGCALAKNLMSVLSPDGRIDAVEMLIRSTEKICESEKIQCGDHVLKQAGDAALRAFQLNKICLKSDGSGNAELLSDLTESVTLYKAGLNEISTTTGQGQPSTESSTPADNTPKETSKISLLTKIKNYLSRLWSSDENESK